MRKFALETSKNLKDLIRKLSIGLTNLAKDVDTLQSDVNTLESAPAASTTPTYTGAIMAIDHRQWSSGNAGEAERYVDRKQIYFSDVIHDTNSIADIANEKFVAPSTGYYKIYGKMGCGNNNYAFFMNVEVDGSSPNNIVHQSQYVASTNAIEIMNFEEIIAATAGDDITFWIWSYADTNFQIYEWGSTLYVPADKFENYIGIQYIGT